MSKGDSHIFTGTSGEGRQLIDEVIANGWKISPNKVVAITRDPNDKIIWLEEGHLGEHPSGLAHILTEHGAQFNEKGISNSEIPQYLMIAVKYGTIVGYQGRGKGRPIYEFEYKGKTHRVAITIGLNGYIVGANPLKTKEA